MRRRLIRGLAISAAAVVAVVAVGVLALHTNPVQSRILDWSIEELERRFDLDLTADDLHFNLATRRVTMTNVRLAAVGHPEAPFFAADAVTVHLPWAAYRGRLRFDEVRLDSGRVSIARDADGVVNLPPGRGTRPPDAPPRRIDVGNLHVRGLDFSYLDAQRDLEIRAPGIRTSLTSSGVDAPSGPFAIDHEVLVRIGDRTVTIEPVNGQMAFDGSDVTLADLDLRTTDGRFRLAGEISRALDRPTLDLTFAGTADLARAARWTTPPVHLAGEAAVDATMTGAPSEFVLDAHVRAAQAEIGRDRRVGVEAEARLTRQGVVVSRSRITPATGGEVQATVDAEFGDDAPWQIDAQWQGLDAATAFRLADVPPLPFGASLRGTARLERARGEPFRLTISNASSPRQFPGTAPLEGRVEFRVAGNRWQATQTHRMGATRADGPLGGVWNRASVRRSTFDGTLAVTTSDVGEAARHAALFGLSTPAIVRTADGPLDATVALGGTFDSPTFAGTASSPGVVIPSIGKTAFTAGFDASASAIRVTEIQATVGAAELRGDVFADLDTRRLDGALEVNAPSAADLLTALPEPLRLDGPLAATAALGGTVDAPDIRVEVTGSDLTLAGQPVSSLIAEARVHDDAITIESLTMRQGEGSVSATGRYAWEDGAYALDVDGRGLTWRGSLARLGDAEARLAVRFSGAGTLDRPVGEGAVEFDLSGGLAGEVIDRGVAQVRLNGSTALVTTHVPSLGAWITATIVPERPFAYDAVVVMNRIELAPLVPLAGVQRGHVTGVASLSATAKGTLASPLESRAFINLQEVDATLADVPVRLVEPARLAWEGDALTIDALDLSVGQGQLRAAGRLGERGLRDARWEAAFDGALGDVVQIGHAFGVPAELEGSGPLRVSWRSTGGIDQSSATLALSQGSLAWGSVPAIHDLVMNARFDGAMITVDELKGQWQDGGIQGTAAIPLALLDGDVGGAATSPAPSGVAKLRVVGLSEAALAPWVSEDVLAGIDGRVSATLDARVIRPSLDGVTATLTLDEADFTLAGVDVTQVRPAVVDVDGGLVTMKDVVFMAGGSPLALTGTARLAPADQQALDLELSGTADLRILSAFTPTVATDGTAKINVGVAGPLDDPLFNGRIDVADVEVAIREPRIIVSDLGGTIALDGRRVVFDGVSGGANGGRLVLDGGFLLDGLTPSAGGVTFVLDGAALEYPDGLQTEVDALVTLQPGTSGWILTGDARVRRGVYNENISLPALLAARRTSAPTALDEPSWADQLRLNVFVSTEQDLRLDNNYGRLEAGAALRVGGTVDDPALSGRITLREGGEVYLAGNTFDIARGSISFTNPNRIEPEFDIELRTLVSGTDIILTLEGPLDRLETDVRSSNPNVDSREAMSMILGGFQGEDAVVLLSSELLGVTGRAVGLDSLRVERGFDIDEFRADPGLIATETDPSTRLTLSKRLRPEVELVLSQSLRESGGLSAIISYKPRRNIELRGVSRDNLDRSVALRHEVTFGGGRSLDDRQAPERPEITAVTLSGEPGLPEAELRGLLDLDPGDPFDFHRWQRDIDALRAHYHERRYYEVRVRGTRQVSDDGLTVALDYRIQPGPVAELRLEGHPLERAIEEDIREAWARAIFDRFLLEDIRSRVLRHLLDEDLVGSTVSAEVTVATPERKEIRVTVRAGAPVIERRLRYTGNQAFDDRRLNAVVDANGLALEGWLEPARLVDALEAFYRGEGYLSADVSAGDPMVQGDAGVLPVAIDEGRQFLIGKLTLPGVNPERVPDVAAAVRLPSNEPFVTATVDAARDRVEDWYARQGFNAVQVDVEAEPNRAAGTVDLAFAIDEGPQQVLREVVTQGASRTRDGVLRRALRLRIGEPVNLAAWSQARKRLYDTNVFRQVDIEPVPIEPTAEEAAAHVQPVRAVVRVVEYPVWRLRYGLQVNDERTEVPDPDGDTRQQNLGVLADVQNQNVFGRAITAGIAGRYEKDRQAGSLFTSNGSFFGLPIRSNGFVFASRQRFTVNENFSTIDERIGLSAEQRWRPFRTSEVIWTYRFQRSHTFDPDPSPLDPFPLDVVAKVSRLGATMFMDRRDDPSDPERGWFTAANYEQAIRALGSDFGNSKLLVQYSRYQRLGRLVLAGRAQLGSAFGEEALISSERFQLGGATTVRGYAENSLGPRDAFGLSGGGDALLNLNGEVRFPVRGWVQGVGFVDAGNVFTNRGDVSLGDLAVGYGLGLRLASPFAMLRIDFGLPAQTISPDRPANQWKSGRWYFGIGHIF